MKAPQKLGSVVVVALLGCARLVPDDVVASTADPPVNPDYIRYRALTRDDFKAEERPSNLRREWWGKFGAACVSLHISPESKIHVVPVPTGQYEARVQTLEFIALLDRNCSWWKRFQSPTHESYLLEHEQIHFAIAEAEARRMNAAFHEIAVRSRAVAATVESAARVTRARIEQELQAADQRMLERHAALDEDTSYALNTKNQTRWWELVHREIRDYARLAAREHAARALLEAIARAFLKYGFVVDRSTSSLTIAAAPSSRADGVALVVDRGRLTLGPVGGTLREVPLQFYGSTFTGMEPHRHSALSVVAEAIRETMAVAGHAGDGSIVIHQ